MPAHHSNTKMVAYIVKWGLGLIFATSVQSLGGWLYLHLYQVSRWTCEWSHTIHQSTCTENVVPNGKNQMILRIDFGDLPDMVPKYRHNQPHFLSERPPLWVRS